MQRTSWSLLLLVFPVLTAVAAFDDVAFETGAGQSGADLRFAIAAIISTLGFIWAAWLFIGTFNGWREGNIKAGSALVTLFRALLVLAVLGAFIR